MGSSTTDKSSFDNEVPVQEEAASATSINRRWESHEVDECLRKKLGERPAHIKRLLGPADAHRNGLIAVADLRTILRKSNLDMSENQFKELLSHFDIEKGLIRNGDFINAYVDFKSDTVPKDVSVINDLTTEQAKLLIQDVINSRLGTGQSELIRAFKFFDRDRTGFITKHDFQEAMKTYAMLHFSDELSENLMKDFDQDGNGEIDYEEFTTLVMGSKKDDHTSLNTSSGAEHASGTSGKDMMLLRNKVRTQWKDLLHAFRDVDTDKSGTLDEAELHRVLHRFNIDLGDSQFAELLKTIVENNDGKVSYAEFMKFFGKGQAEDRILHTVVRNVTLKKAQEMMADKVAERYGGGPAGPAQMKKAFHFFDHGQTGFITTDDFKEAMVQYTGLEFEAQILGELVAPFNDGNGQIDYNEFASKGMGDSGSTGMDVGSKKFTRHPSKDKPQSPPMDAPANPKQPAAPSRSALNLLKFIAEKVEAKSRNIAVTFRNFDEDKSGSVDYVEFRKGLMHLGVELSDEDFASLLAVVDNDRSGHISYNEFVEDLKSVDEQTGGFMGGEPQAQKKVARVSIAEPKAIVQQAPGRSSGTILHQIADKVEQKSKNIRVVFRNFDEDKSGSVDYQEFRKGLEHIGIILTDVDYQTLLDVVDNDKSGTICYNEFVEDLKHVDEQVGGFQIGAAAPAPAPRAPAPAPAPTFAPSGRSGVSILHQVADKVEQKSKNVRVVFRNFDEDKSGSVDYVEFRRGLTHLGIALSDADFQSLIEILDNDQSGTIDYNEFVEDLKHVDEQVGGHGHNDSSQQQEMKARQRPQPRQEMGGPDISGSGAGGLGIQGISAV